MGVALTTPAVGGVTFQEIWSPSTRILIRSAFRDLHYVATRVLDRGALDCRRGPRTAPDSKEFVRDGSCSARLPELFGCQYSQAVWHVTTCMKSTAIADFEANSCA